MLVAFLLRWTLRLYFSPTVSLTRSISSLVHQRYLCPTMSTYFVSTYFTLTKCNLEDKENLIIDL
ncbi:hypothetical protein AAHE18_04G143500 [Arachis hypogaea]